MSTDPHAPTTAGPTPVPPGTVADAPAPADVPLPASAAAAGREGTELPFGIPPDHPEILVGAAFAGGVLAAIILKRFGGD
jgi:hypothetical protein